MNSVSFQDKQIEYTEICYVWIYWFGGSKVQKAALSEAMLGDGMLGPWIKVGLNGLTGDGKKFLAKMV